MSGVRVTYSGLISFAVSIGSIFTGTLFTLIVTRQLTQEEFGTWSLIGSLTAYVFVIQPIISLWITREIARGEETGKTALVSNNMFTVAGIIVYLILVFVIGTQSDANLDVLFLAAILIPVNFLRNLLASISSGFKPQLTEYSFLVLELTKIPLGFIFVYFLEMGLVGAILTMVIATLSSSVLLLISLKEKISGQFKSKYLKKWLKLFWIPSYPQLSRIIWNSDIIVFSLITGSVGAIAYWGASSAIAKGVVHASKINIGLYPKLLGGGKKEIFHDNLIRVLYFAFPLISMTIIFSEPALFALNPIYREAFPIVIILSFFSFQILLKKIFISALQGTEKVDADEKSTFKDYIKSRLFYLPTSENILSASYIVVFTVVLLIYAPQELSDIELVIIWTLVSTISDFPFIIYLYILVRREFTLKVNFRIISKYLLTSTIVYGLTYLLMQEFLTYHLSIFEFLPEFLLYIIIGASGYVGITYVIDKNTRKLVKAIMQEFIIKSKGNKNGK